MDYGALIDLAKNRIDETDVDTQIDTIVKNAINHAYLFDISKREPRISVAYVPVINGLATLPDDINDIVSITPALVYGERRVGNVILSSRTVTFTIVYSTVPAPLVNTTDIPDVSEKWHYSMSTYACYEYFMYRKKTTQAQAFYNTYQTELTKLDDNEYTGEETVYDEVGEN